MPATRSEGASVHPKFLRIGPWALSMVVSALFLLAFGTSYAALYDYALQLGFDRPFAIAFPLVLDAVISVLAVALLLERALGQRTVRVRDRQVAVHLPSWPMLALWLYFAGSVAGNVGHAPPVLAAQLVAAVPPVSAMLTFHLLLRLLDRAATLRTIAETFEEQRLEAAERAEERAERARERAHAKAQAAAERAAAKARPPVEVGSRADQVSRPNGSPASSNGAHPPAQGEPVSGEPTGSGEPAKGARAAEPTTGPPPGGWEAAARDVWARERAEGRTPSGAELARLIGCSPATGKRLAAKLRAEPPRLAVVAGERS